jgi:hypothetical protein
MKKQTRFQQEKTTTKFILQAKATVRCCSVAEHQQWPLLPRRRFGCRPAKLMLALTHGDEKANAISAGKNNHKIHLTSHSICKLLFCSRASAMAFAPSSPIWLPSCKTHVGPHAQKSKRNISR